VERDADETRPIGLIAVNRSNWLCCLCQLISSPRLAVYPDRVQTKGGDVVVLVMPGVSVVYLGEVHQDGEGLDSIKERFTATSARQALADARAITRKSGGRILKWMKGANEPDLWPATDSKLN